MTYQNRVPAEGINTDEASHPLKEFLILTVSIALGAGLIVGALGLSAQFLAKYIPFRFEQQLAARFEQPGRQPAHGKQEAALQAVLDRVLPGLDLPPGMSIKLHYIDSKTVNAFATLGGHVFVFRGLLDKMQSENALAFVLAHEIAHVKHRHPAQALGRSVAIGLALTAVSTGAGESMAGRPLGAAGLLTSLQFTRSHETEADSAALQALVRTYGNAAGALQTFAMFMEIGSGSEKAPELLRTHPASDTRGANVRALAQMHGWPLEGQLVPLSGDLKAVGATPPKAP